MSSKRRVLATAICLASVASIACSESVQIVAFPLLSPVVEVYKSGNPPAGAKVGDFIYNVFVRNFGKTQSPAMYFWITAYGNCGGAKEFPVPALNPNTSWAPPTATVQSVTGCPCQKDTCDGTMWVSLRTGPATVPPGPGAPGCPGPGLAGPSTGFQVWWDASGDLAKFRTLEHQELQSSCGAGQ